MILIRKLVLYFKQGYASLRGLTLNEGGGFIELEGGGFTELE